MLNASYSVCIPIHFNAIKCLRKFKKYEFYFYNLTTDIEMKKLLSIVSITLIFFACSSDDDDSTPRVGVDSHLVSLSFTGDPQYITVDSNTDWTVKTDADWITLSTQSGVGSATIEITASRNEEAADRSANIIIKNLWLKEIHISVTQSKLAETTGLYILSEGNWGSAQAEIAHYDIGTGTISKKYFGSKNAGIKLGDTGNDLAIYGSKMYCVVTGKDMAEGGYIQIIDPQTGIATKRVEMTDSEGKKDMPRKIAFYKDKAYITMYSGEVARLDTASLSIDGRAKLSGTYPEGICVYNRKLYICNSGQGKDKTISVVGTTSFKEEKTITVPMNPVAIVATRNGEIYFTTATLSWSTGEPANLHLLDAKTEKVIKTFDIRASRLALGEDYLYTVENETDWTNYESVDYSYKIDLKTKESSVFTTSLWEYFMAYNINVNPSNGDVYIGGQGQDVAILGKDGVLKKSLKVGTGFTNTIIPIFK